MERGRTPAFAFGTRRLALMAGILAVVMLLTTSGLIVARLGRDDEDATRQIDRVQVLDPPRSIPEVALTSGSGGTLTLADLRGMPVLLFFGYTHCPDVCPTSLAVFRQVKEKLGDAGRRVHFVFVSVDGARDTPAVVDTYVQQFDPDFIGLTGAETDVRQLGEAFNLYFARAEPASGASGYLVDHTAYSYLIDPAGRLRIIYPYGTPADRMSDDLQSFVQ